MFKSKSKSQQATSQVRGHAKDLADRLAPHVDTAKDKAGPLIADARTKAAPVIADARTKWDNDVVPSVSAAVTAASQASEPYRDEARKRGRAVASALKGEVAAPKKKKRRFRKFLGLAGLAGIAALIAKSLSDRESTTAWQSTYEPSSSPTPPAPAEAAGAGAGASTTGGKHVDDEAASSPDEALADAEESPHKATDPDHPAEQVAVKKKATKKK